MTCVVTSAGLPPNCALQNTIGATQRRVEKECFTLSTDSVYRLDVFHEGEKTLGESGGNIDGALQKRVGLFREHDSAEDLHEFAAFRVLDGSAHDAATRIID